ncbi:transposase family protein [Streptomyces sp. NPDC058695]|uniref:transposase family protein n=1 Tax=Streptomyces sp. NPDC058695 TaxID=3346604 RepID=UPI00365A0594
MTKKWARAALTHPAFCGVSRAHLGDVIEELADLWLARRESELRERRGVERQRAAGAGPKHDLVFTDRLLVTLVHLRTGLPHAALAELYGIALVRPAAPPYGAASSGAVRRTGCSYAGVSYAGCARADARDSADGRP